MPPGCTNILEVFICPSAYPVDPMPLHPSAPLGVEAVGTLQLLHQLNVVLLGGRGRDLVFDRDLLPCVVLVFLLEQVAQVSENNLGVGGRD